MVSFICQDHRFPSSLIQPQITAESSRTLRQSQVSITVFTPPLLSSPHLWPPPNHILEGAAGSRNTHPDLAAAVRDLGFMAQKKKKPRFLLCPPQLRGRNSPSPVLLSASPPLHHSADPIAPSMSLSPSLVPRPTNPLQLLDLLLLDGGLQQRY